MVRVAQLVRVEHHKPCACPVGIGATQKDAQVMDLAPVRLFLTGPAGSGKSTLAGILVERHGFTRISLGDIPRALAAKRGVAPTRAVLQKLGDELRGGDPARLARLVLPQIYGEARIVVDGVRLPEEADVLRAAGCVGVALKAPALVRYRRLSERGERWADGVEASHPTETAHGSIAVQFWVDAAGTLLPFIEEASVLVAAADTAARHRMTGPKRPERR